MPALFRLPQFESIHPFTDGIGRIGRALIGAVSRRRGPTKNTVTQIASAMVADVDTYFSLVNNYRSGDVDPFVLYLARSAVRASDAARESVAALDALPSMWLELARPRKGSAAGIITLITQSKRSRAWAATEVLDEVDMLNQRLADTWKLALLRRPPYSIPANSSLSSAVSCFRIAGVPISLPST